MADGGTEEVFDDDGGDEAVEGDGSKETIEGRRLAMKLRECSVLAK
jgi:hypothetical protein